MSEDEKKRGRGLLWEISHYHSDEVIKTTRNLPEQLAA
jgi:hypothetical protein